MSRLKIEKLVEEMLQSILEKLRFDWWISSTRKKEVIGIYDLHR